MSSSDSHNSFSGWTSFGNSGAKSSPDLSWVTKRNLSTGSAKSRMTLLNNIPLAKRQSYVTRNNASAVPEGMHWTAKRVERARLVQSYLRGLPDCPTRQEDGLLIWGDRLAVAGFLGRGATNTAWVLCGLANPLISVAVKKAPSKYATREADVLSTMTGLVLRGEAINFPVCYAIKRCIEGPQHDYTLFVNEVANGTLFSEFGKMSTYTKTQWLSGALQVLFGLMQFLQQGWVHDDLHPGNVLVHNVPAGGCWQYIINDLTLYVPNHGHLLVLWDFESAEPVSRAERVDTHLELDHVFYHPTDAVHRMIIDIGTRRQDIGVLTEPGSLPFDVSVPHGEVLNDRPVLIRF